jgi:hypothetical protein
MDGFGEALPLLKVGEKLLLFEIRARGFETPTTRIRSERHALLRVRVRRGSRSSL